MTISVPEGGLLAPLSGGAPRSLVVLLHGYGADGNDLIPLAAAWRQSLPDTAFVVPDAPERCDGHPFGRQWFPLTFGDPSRIKSGLAAALPRLNPFLDKTLEEMSLRNSDLVLAGFSQGAMLALQAGLRRPGPIAGIVGFSGLLGSAPAPGGTYPPVLLGHGSDDQIIPATAMGAALEGLKAAGVQVEAMLRPGLGHGIDETEVLAAARFLAAVLGYAKGLKA